MILSTFRLGAAISNPNRIDNLRLRGIWVGGYLRLVVVANATYKLVVANATTQTLMYPYVHRGSMHQAGQLLSSYRDIYPLSKARNIAFELRERISHFYNGKIVIAGSILRKKDFVHDIDIVIDSTNEDLRRYCANLLDCFASLGKISGKYANIPVQIWFCPKEEWAPMLLEVTGPKNFNQFLRSCAKRQGLYLSSKGLFLKERDRMIRIDNNTEGHIIYIVIGKAWIPPEMRY